MTDTSSRIVIAGAGHAGGSVAALLRQYGWKGPITLIGAEPVAPYQRPPLSKAWLKGEGDLASLLLRPAAFYPANGIELRLASQVVRIDPTDKAFKTDGCQPWQKDDAATPDPGKSPADVNLTLGILNSLIGGAQAPPPPKP